MAVEHQPKRLNQLLKYGLGPPDLLAPCFECAFFVFDLGKKTGIGTSLTMDHVRQAWLLFQHFVTDKNKLTDLPSNRGEHHAQQGKDQNGETGRGGECSKQEGPRTQITPGNLVDVGRQLVQGSPIGKQVMKQLNWANQVYRKKRDRNK